MSNLLRLGVSSAIVIILSILLRTNEIPDIFDKFYVRCWIATVPIGVLQYIKEIRVNLVIIQHKFVGRIILDTIVVLFISTIVLLLLGVF